MIDKPNRHRRGPSQQRQKNETQSISSQTDGVNEVFVGALYVSIETISEEKTSRYRMLSINNTELSCAGYRNPGKCHVADLFQ